MSASRMAIWKKTAAGLGLVLAIFAAAALAPARAVPDNDAEAKMAAESPGKTPADLEKLFEEGRYQAAAELAARLGAEAAARGDEAGATLALIREVQARIGLGASETALRLLLDRKEPAGRRERLIYRLFRGETLSRYFDAYGWEIRQREESGAIDKIEVDKWTADQLNGEILRSFGGAWEEREAWGAESVEPLAGLLEQNDYPARIRGTLRDTLSYLFAEALGNSSRFTPQQGNEIYRLDLGALLAPAAPAADGAALDPALHPLERLARVLADLEAWHRANGRPEAALEAYLTRLDSLRVHFSAEEDRERFDRELAATLSAFPPALEWRAMGLVRLGEWRREGDRPDALKRAHATFQEAAKAFPKSIGGRRARALLDQLEMPQLGFEATYIDGPGRPSLTVDHANVKRLHLRAYQLPAEAERSFATMFRSEARALAELVRGSRPVAEWQAELRDPGDFRTHRTYLAPPLEKLGHYVIFASERPDFALENNQAMALRLTLSEMVVLGRPLLQALETEVEVRAGRDGKALPGTSLELLSSTGRNPYRSVARQETDGEGKAGFDLIEVDPGSQLYLAASRGADHIFTGSWLQRPYVAPQETLTEAGQLIFTDRGVYRPGQQILFKAIAYQLDKRTRARRVMADQPLTVELFDANGQQVASLPLRTNRHGSVSGAIPIPAGRMLGDWSLRSGGAWRSLKVEEYKRPTFELALLDPAEPLRLNQEARLAGTARYYFGMPLRAGKVSWRVTRTPNYPRWWYFFPPVRETQNVASGVGPLDAEGRFEIAFLPRADERLAATAEGREIGYSYRVSAELTDEGGETRTVERSFRAGFVMVDASLEPARPFFGEKEKIEVALRRFDLDGKGRAGRGSWRLLRLAAEKPLLPAEMPVMLPRGGEAFALPGDRTPPRHQATYDEAAARRLLKDGPEVARGELAADESGSARLSLPAVSAGLYRLRYETADEAGAKIERSAEILVAREKMPGVGLAVVLEADRATAEPGEQLRLAAGSGLAQVPSVVEIFRGERRVFRQELPPGEMGLLRYQVAAEDRGGLVVEIKAVADYQLLNLRRTIEVPIEKERLKVSFASFRDRLRPGQREKFTIAVESIDGASLDPQLIEILSSMYDRSLDLFAPPPAGSPFARYDGHPQVMRVWSSIQHSYPFFRAERPGPASEYPQLRGDRLTLYDRVDIGGVRGGFGGGVKTMAMASPMAESMPMGRAMADAAGAPPPPPPPAPQMVAALQGSGEGGAAAPAPLRENFAETAFFEPHLEPGNDGRVSFEFEVPDSVTEWNVFTHALSDDFRFGSDRRTTRTVKELQVRPYLPRFLREGDLAELRVSVDNTGEAGVLEGAVDLELLDEQTGRSVLGNFGLDPRSAAGRSFKVEPGKSAILTFPFKVPATIGPVVLRVVGKTLGRAGSEGDLSDGEQRLLPILPSRLHLVQSRFAVMDDRARRTLAFEELRQGGDPSRIDEKLVLTLDGQLFTSVLRALPYLVDYPYRCTEQNLNRFASTGIMTALFDRHPAIARLAGELAKRDTPLEPLLAQDPNRGVLLEESPWLAASRGGEVAEGAQLERILDPKIARAVRDGALEELRQAQDPSGGFPWWPGGQPSVFFTVYLLQGFARAAEAGVEVPREMIEGAWGFVYRELAPEIEKLKDPKQMRESWYTVTWLNYVLSTYPDPSWTGGAFSEEDRARMLDASLLHWRELPRRVRLYLALTAHRMGRAEDAERVLESVMDGARTTPDQGTFWQPEDRAWLFWWDRIETHAVALRTLMEVAPQDERRHGLVLWLMLNKKLNQWNSTRSTAEVIYSLAAYLEKEGELGVREVVKVDFAGKREQIVFEPDSVETRRQLVQPGDLIEPARDAEIEIEKETPGLLFASATWHFSTEKLPAAASSDFFAARRRYFRRAFTDGQYRLEPLDQGAEIAVGDEVEVELEIEAKHAAEFVHLRDPRAAGFEPVDLVSGWRWDLGIGHYREIRDSATNFFFETLPPGKLTLKYRLRASTAGTFRVGPATLQSMYAPEFAAYSAGAMIEIVP